MNIAFYISNDEEKFGYMPAHSSWQEEDEITVDGQKCYIYAIEEKNDLLMHKIITPMFNAARKVASGRAKWAYNKIDLFCESVEKYSKALMIRKRKEEFFREWKRNHPVEVVTILK